jgi:hypothetical protein
VSSFEGYIRNCPLNLGNFPVTDLSIAGREFISIHSTYCPVFEMIGNGGSNGLPRIVLGSL